MKRRRAFVSHRGGPKQRTKESTRCRRHVQRRCGRVEQQPQSSWSTLLSCELSGLLHRTLDVVIESALAPTRANAISAVLQKECLGWRVCLENIVVVWPRDG